MKNTPNYNLPQYEGTDKFTKEVLNDAFSKLDTAIDDLQETFNSSANGGALITQEVINARKGKENLREKIDEIDKVLTENVYINISTEEFTHSNGTKYWITKIPYLNEDGTKNILKKSFANGVANVRGNEGNFTNGEFIIDHYKRMDCSFSCNASAFESSKRLIGTQIKDGIVYQECETNENYKKNYVLGVTNENKLKVYEYNTSSAQMISDGVINTFCFMTPIILNGSDVSQSIKDLYSNGYTLLANRQMIAQKQNSNDIYILTSEGRTLNNVGLTFQHCTDILLSHGMYIAYALDGGGSATTVVNGYCINNPSEVTGEIKERLTSDMIYFDKNINSPTGSKETISSLEKDILQIKRELIELRNKNDFLNYVKINSDETYNSKGIMIYENGVATKRLVIDKSGLAFLDVSNNNAVVFKVLLDGTVITSKGNLGMDYEIPNKTTDCNLITKSGRYWVTNATPNSPMDISYAIEHYQIDGVNAMQIAYPYANDVLKKIKTRRTSGGSWTAWRDLN